LIDPVVTAVPAITATDCLFWTVLVCSLIPLPTGPSRILPAPVDFDSGRASAL
jgi:hypothetical protein